MIILNMNSLAFSDAFETVELVECVPNHNCAEELNGFIVALNMPDEPGGVVRLVYWALPLSDRRGRATAWTNYVDAGAYLDARSVAGGAS